MKSNWATIKCNWVKNPIIVAIHAVMLGFVLWLSSAVHAELVIPIVEGVDNPTVIAVVPFADASSSPLSEDVAAIVSADLYRSGQFRPLAPRDMLSFPARPSDVVYRDWRLLNSDYLVIGSMETRSNEAHVKYSLIDIASQRTIIDDVSVSAPKTALRSVAHHISDKIYEAITGVRGAFSTQILYVEQRAKNEFLLILADMDGARPQLLLRSAQPLLSPAWSPDARRVAYVSFETSRPAIFIQEIATGKREQVTNFSGLNGAPAWSPDGKKLAMVLSKDGNPEIYTLDLSSRIFTRLTNHFAIDTEPTWSIDGRSILFTSNRGGRPQIYKITLQTGDVERLTFEGDYNARPQVTLDGKAFVMVHQVDGVFHIALQDLQNAKVRVLTRTQLDESPSIAPNGISLLYATKAGDRGILAGASLDGRVRYKLPATTGDVREPAWSPFLSN